jgi:fumarate reductase subunit C
MSNKQTAVQILVNSLIKLGYLHSNEFGQSPKVIELINQAKEMEKEQIMEAHYAPKYGCFTEDYYEQTYGGNK